MFPICLVADTVIEIILHVHTLTHTHIHTHTQDSLSSLLKDKAVSFPLAPHPLRAEEFLAWPAHAAVPAPGHTCRHSAGASHDYHVGVCHMTHMEMCHMTIVWGVSRLGTLLTGVMVVMVSTGVWASEVGVPE